MRIHDSIRDGYIAEFARLQERIADHRPGQLVKPSQEPLRTKRPAAERNPKRRGWGMGM
jgi:hypothetical protein